MKKTYQTPETTVINIKLQQITAATTATDVVGKDSKGDVLLNYGGGAGAEMEMRSRSTNHWDE